ncbi:ABC transporter permease [Oceanibium sediminis]|uniref:ABC transporter permease n=1 Tax=Oceanibium sediminis TaxID=2026339 RepID=UPI000DD306F3|nr:ABC transporter permease [Oceanibium sediminis]
MAAQKEVRQSILLESFVFLELIYFTTVREVRKASGNATLGLLMAVARIMMMVAMFYIMFTVIAFRGASIRGNIILFLLGGVLLFFLHNSAVSAVIKAGSSVSAMMQHAPMTPSLAIIASALSTLYLHLFAIAIILTGMWVWNGELVIHNPAGTILPFMLAWSSGIVIGLLFLLLKPFAPSLMKIASLVYQRANLITSGKFFVANMIPNAILPFFIWNPLFHTIDQMRGHLFVNYFPHKTSIEYPLYFTLVGLLIGMMGEFFLRKTVSRSTSIAN